MEVYDNVLSRTIFFNFENKFLEEIFQFFFFQCPNKGLDSRLEKSALAVREARGVMGDQFGTTPETPQYNIAVMYERLFLNICSLSDGCAPDHCSFSSSFSL